MVSMLKKMMYFGLGALSLTRERAEDFFNEMVERGEMSRDEARDYVDEMLSRGERERQELMSEIRSYVQSLKTEMGLVSRDELDEIKARLDRLENQQG
ncbi:MAG: phasin family protein [Methylocystaceae bacterium]